MLHGLLGFIIQARVGGRNTVVASPEIALVRSGSLMPWHKFILSGLLMWVFAGVTADKEIQTLATFKSLSPDTPEPSPFRVPYSTLTVATPHRALLLERLSPEEQKSNE